MNTLEYRTNNAYDSVLLVEDGTVIGAWDAAVVPRDHLDNPGDLSDWDATYPDCTDPDDYGTLLWTKAGIRVEHLDAEEITLEGGC